MTEYLPLHHFVSIQTYNTDIEIQNFKLSFSDNMVYWIL